MLDTEEDQVEADEEAASAFGCTFSYALALASSVGVRVSVYAAEVRERSIGGRSDGVMVDELTREEAASRKLSSVEADVEA